MPDNNNDARKQLVNFIDKKAFDVILKTSPDNYNGQEREEMQEIIRKTKNEQQKFHEYSSATEVKKNFFQMCIPKQQKN